MEEDEDPFVWERRQRFWFAKQSPFSLKKTCEAKVAAYPSMTS
jgi:hypothetical protein